ncbi:MAG: GDP-mannose 4,6-dehydratase [Chloroflexi bacterium]|nr:GDP-mannose 4,6-dehydratase [Chloroflexota bacterium]
MLVTGAAGFIGSRVAGLLLENGDAVVGVDNLNDAYDVRLKHWRLRQLEGRPGFEFHRLDVCDRRALRELFEQGSGGAGERERGRAGEGERGREGERERGRVGIDAVINLAARAGVRQSVENPWVYIDTNVTGTLNLLELCREFGVRKFVLASTSSLYGKDNPMPYREDANTDHPLSPYAASKKAAEALCYTYHYLYGIDVTVFRYFTVYGPAGRPDMSLFRFVQWISEGRPVTVFGDGQQSRDFTYVDDIARGTIAGLKPLTYATINLGSDKPLVLLQAIQLIEQLVGCKAEIEFKPRHPADVVATWADISQAWELLGWTPKVGYEQGIENLVEWYRANRDWAREIRTGAG